MWFVRDPALWRNTVCLSFTRRPHLHVLLCVCVALFGNCWKIRGREHAHIYIYVLDCKQHYFMPMFNHRKNNWCVACMYHALQVKISIPNVCLVGNPCFVLISFQNILFLVVPRENACEQSIRNSKDMISIDSHASCNSGMCILMLCKMDQSEVQVIGRIVYDWWTCNWWLSGWSGNVHLYCHYWTTWNMANLRERCIHIITCLEF